MTKCYPCQNFLTFEWLDDDALLTGQEMFVENVVFIFSIEFEDGAAVLQKRRYDSAKIQGVT